MNYGMIFKSNNKINSNKEKDKYKIKNSTANNTIIVDPNTNRIVVDSFRKGLLKESNISLGVINKDKTSQNSPNHFLNKNDKSKELRSLSGKQSDELHLHNLQINSILSTSTIKKLFKENIGFDNLFKRKLQMMNNKHLNKKKGQITYSNIYNSNNSSSKNMIKKSLYQKIRKNESFGKKKSSNQLDDDVIISNYNNNSNSSKLIQNNIEQDSNMIDNTYQLRNPIINLKGNKGEVNLNNNFNNRKGLKRPGSSSSLIHSSSHKAIGKDDQNGNNSQLLRQLDKMNSFSNNSIINEFKKMNHTSFPSKKNSIEIKKNDSCIHNLNHENSKQILLNPFSSTLKLSKYNEVFNIQKSDSKRSTSNLLKKKYINGTKSKYQSIINNSNSNASLILLNSFSPSTATKPSNITNNWLLNNQEIKAGATPNNLSDIKFIEYVTSNMKNYSTSKNSCNKLIKKNKKTEKDYFLTKLKVMNKSCKSLTTVQSKQNSKSNSRIEDYLNMAPSNKPNEDILGNMSNKNKKAIQMYSLISNKKSIPVQENFCISPTSKTGQEILKKINLKKITDQEIELKAKKAEFRFSADCLKVTPNSLESSINIAKIDDNILSLERRRNETSESIQSTAREAVFYKKEMEKVALYVKKYYNLNKAYPASIIQFYKFGRIIGKGAFGKVNLALHICSGRLVAVKSFKKSKQKSKHSKNKIKNEIEVLKQLQHPFISQILDTFETNTHTVIVMEYICGDLLSFIRKRSKLSEASAKIIFKQLIEGIKFIHQNKIVHRDIKLDNILFDLNNTVKICDFGVSRKLNPGDIMHDHCGTPAYIAPEIFLNKGYEGYSCDIWSAGVTLYYMISGSQPFKANNLPDLQQVIIEGKYEKIEGVSSEVRDLIDGMLQIDTKKRITITQILSHPWLNGVNLRHKNDFPLFTTAELVLLAKYNVNYLSSNKEDMIENFTMKNIITEKEEDGNKYGNTKSLILAPYNSNASSNDSIMFSEISIQNHISKFGGKVKQVNVKYELNNNKEFDNGMIITKHESENKLGVITSSSNGSSSKPLSPQVELDYNTNNHSDNLKLIIEEDMIKEEEINEALVNEIEKCIGFKKEYLIECLYKKEVNYATATYHLLNKEIHSKMDSL